MSVLSQRLPAAIREKRIKLKMSQERLAEIIGVSVSYVGQVERGDCQPSIDKLAEFVCFLGLNANDLFYGIVSNQADIDELCGVARQLDEKKLNYLISPLDAFNWAVSPWLARIKLIKPSQKLSNYIKHKNPKIRRFWGFVELLN